MSAEAYAEIIRAPQGDRLYLFLATANRLGTPVGNVEKDFWVCWTLDALYHRLPADRPRLLFKGGTSLSKAYGLIRRFSEDIDVTVFRDDLDQPASVEELEALSGKKRRAKLNAIREACRAYIMGPLQESLAELVADATNGAGRIEADAADPDGQTLLVWYPEVEPRVMPCSPAGVAPTMERHIRDQTRRRDSLSDARKAVSTNLARAFWLDVTFKFNCRDCGEFVTWDEAIGDDEIVSCKGADASSKRSERLRVRA